MTKEEAEHVSHDHLVDQIVRNTRQLNVASDENNIDEEEGDHSEQNHYRRAETSWDDLELVKQEHTGDKGQKHLIGLSWIPTKRVSRGVRLSVMYDTIMPRGQNEYMYEASAGAGAHIYIIDTLNFGLDWPVSRSSSP